MSEEKRNPSDEIIEEATAPDEVAETDSEKKAEEKEPPKHAWQALKESWYDKVPLTVKQLDIIIALGIIGMIVLAIVIALDANGVF